MIILNTFFPVSFWQHFHDGRKAQQQIESSWKQLESVSNRKVDAQYIYCPPVAFESEQKPQDDVGKHLRQFVEVRKTQ